MISKPVTAALFAALLATAASIPAGTDLHIRLETPVTASAAMKQGVEAVVIQPVMIGETVGIPAGTRLTGEVKEHRPAAKPDERALLRIQFSKILGRGGKAAPIDATLVDVDNARETVDAKGDIIGILASETLAARMEHGIRKVGERYPGLADVLESMKGSFGVGEANPDIKYEPGVEMTLRLNKPLNWTADPNSPEPHSVRGIEPAGELARLVNQEPFRTRAERPPTPSDITNLMFVGTEDEIRRAFEQAGWATAEALSNKSTLETIRAVIEGRGYKEAPVSVLLLDGRPPDLVFEKQNDTFAMRHHLRIWRRPGQFNDRPVWVCAATHDIGIDFSSENGTFIHRIDPHIDRERSKVVSDLLFTGVPRAVSLVERPAVPTHAMNATGDELITDGRIAVLEF
jgi:hypothetical protein